MIRQCLVHVWFWEDRFEAVADQLKLSENLALSEGRKPPRHFIEFSNILKFLPLKKSLELLIIFP